jgi:3-oxoisoapionate kinase
MTLRLAFYGDDFTGSTDALEVLAFAGLNCALFLKAPTPTMLERFGTLDAIDAIGVAGDSRAMTPAEMDAALPAPLQALARLAPIVHYKVCSTFDSAPAIGSIGRVIEIARRELGAAAVPGNDRHPALGR